MSPGSETLKALTTYLQLWRPRRADRPGYQPQDTVAPLALAGGTGADTVQPGEEDTGLVDTGVRRGGTAPHSGLQG